MESKIAHLVAASKDTADCLVIPEPESTLYLADHFAHVVCSKYCAEIREQILQSGNWTPISEVIKIDANEKIRVYRNVSAH